MIWMLLGAGTHLSLTHLSLTLTTLRMPLVHQGALPKLSIGCDRPLLNSTDRTTIQGTRTTVRWPVGTYFRRWGCISLYRAIRPTGPLAARLSALSSHSLPRSSVISIGSPLYRELSLTLDNGKRLRISAPSNAPLRPYVNGVRFNGVSLKALAIQYEELRKGGTLEFDMAREPCTAEWPCTY
jgi:hypothetical protein